MQIRSNTFTWLVVAAIALVGCASESSSTTPSSPGSAPADFLYQTRVGDGTPDASGARLPDIGVFVSVDGKVERVDQAAPGTRHKHPIWTSDGAQVAFVAEGAWDAQGAVVRGSEVWVVDPTGDNPRSLISCDCWDLNNVAWSPDGEKVAYAEYDAPNAAGPPAASRIVVVELATRQRTVVVESESGQLVDIPRWSPDGQSLVVSIDRFDVDGNETGSSFGIVPSAGGGSLTPLVPFEKYGYAADWNWVTNVLVFSVETQEWAAADHQASPWDLFEIRPDGTGLRALTDVGDGQRLALPMWSSDGTLIAVSLDTTPGQPGGVVAAVLDPATGAITQLGVSGEYAALRPTTTSRR